MTNTPSINTGESDKWFYKAQTKKRRQLKISPAGNGAGTIARCEPAKRRRGFCGPEGASVRRGAGLDFRRRHRSTQHAIPGLHRLRVVRGRGLHRVTATV